MLCPHGSPRDAAMGFFLLIPVAWTSLSRLQGHLGVGLRRRSPMHPTLQGSQHHGETVPWEVAGHQPSPSLPPAQTRHASPAQAMVSINYEKQVPVGGIYSAVKGEPASPPHAPGEQLRVAQAAAQRAPASCGWLSPNAFFFK